MTGLPPRIVLLHRRSEYAELLARHGTVGQARFFLQSRGRDLEELAQLHAELEGTRATVDAELPPDWRRARVERRDLSRFYFEPGDIVIAVGQDGLVANVAKYLHGQPVIGVTPGAGTGPLCRHSAADVGDLARGLLEGSVRPERRTMVAAHTDDGQSLTALNEVYLGHGSHQTARYELRVAGAAETQASSGLVVGTGSGATGWCRSLWAERTPAWSLPAPLDRGLAWFVREAWPSPTTGASLTSGLLTDAELGVEVHSDRLVVFGDGLEDDRLIVGWGQRVRIGVASHHLALV